MRLSPVHFSDAPPIVEPGEVRPVRPLLRPAGSPKSEQCCGSRVLPLQAQLALDLPEAILLQTEPQQLPPSLQAGAAQTLRIDSHALASSLDALSDKAVDALDEARLARLLARSDRWVERFTVAVSWQSCGVAEAIWALGRLNDTCAFTRCFTPASDDSRWGSHTLARLREISTRAKQDTVLQLDLLAGLPIDGASANLLIETKRQSSTLRLNMDLHSDFNMSATISYLRDLWWPGGRGEPGDLMFAADDAAARTSKTRSSERK